MLVAKYTTNASGILPTFNSGFQYTVNETESNGIYTVELSSDTDFTSCSFNGKSELLTVEYLKVTSEVTSMYNMFHTCSQLTQLDVSNWDTSNVTDMNNMFYNCSQLTQLDVSNFDTSQVTNMSYMFNSCSQLTQLDVSNFDTSNATNMSYMFQYCSKLTQLDVSNWDTSSVISMYAMFQGCSQLTQLDVSNWNISNVTNMSSMFNSCSQLTQLDVSKWNTSNVQYMSYMFQNCSQLTQLDVSNWDTSKVTNMGEMFHNCSNLRKIKILNTNFPQLLDVLPKKGSNNQGYLFTYKEIPNEKNWVSYICEDFNTKFRLPQPLRSIDGIEDRLYWDYNKGHYCIEKNINEDYTILDTPIIIDLPIKNRISMVYDTKTRINTNTIKTQVELSNPIYKIKPMGLEPNKTYTLRFICLGAETVTIDLGGRIIEVSPIDDRVDIQIQTLETLTNEYISIYGNGGTVTNVMLFEGMDIGEVGYIDNITSVGKLQKDGSYKINLMTSPYILKGGK